MSCKSRKVQKIRIANIKLNDVELVGYSDSYQKKRISRMAQSLQEEGQLEPIYTNEDFTTIWKGHTRYLAARDILKWEFIEAVIMNAEEWSACVSKHPEKV